MKKSHRGKSAAAVDLDHTIWVWYFDEIKQGRKPSRSVVQSRARKIYHSFGLPNFKASNSWYRRWRSSPPEQNFNELSSTENPFSCIDLSIAGNQRKDSEKEKFSDYIAINASTDGRELISRSEAVNIEVCSQQSTNVIENSSLSSNIDENIGEGINVHLREKCKKGEKYLPEFKEKVVTYTKYHSIKDASERFQVNRETISKWKRELVGSVKVSEIPGCDSSKFVEWIARQCELGNKVSREEVKQVANQILSQNSHTEKWICDWLKRFEEEDNVEGRNDLTAKRYHTVYPISFKREIAEYARCHSKSHAATVFNVDRHRISDWMKDTKLRDKKYDIGHEVLKLYNDALEQNESPTFKDIKQWATKLAETKGIPFKASYTWYVRWKKKLKVDHNISKLDQSMLDWVLQELDLNVDLDYNTLQMKALAISKDPNFKASRGWAMRFCRRYPKLLQDIPDISTPLPKFLMKRIDEYSDTIHSYIENKKIPAEAIGCMDEIFLHFTTAVDDKQEPSPCLRKPRMKSCYATIILSACADGRLLSPCIIAKDQAENEEIAEHHIPFVLFENNAQMTSEHMHWWLQNVWSRKHINEASVLVVDCFQPHVHADVKRNASKLKTTIFIIPPGCTSRLQPLTSQVKQIFLEHIRSEWNGYSCSGHKLQMASLGHVLSWIQGAYEKLKEQKELLKQGFFEVGLLPLQHSPVSNEKA